MKKSRTTCIRSATKALAMGWALSVSFQVRSHLGPFSDLSRKPWAPTRSGTPAIFERLFARWQSVVEAGQICSRMPSEPEQTYFSLPIFATTRFMKLTDALPLLMPGIGKRSRWCCRLLQHDYRRVSGRITKGFLSSSRINGPIQFIVTSSRGVALENRLRLLYALQQVDLGLDELQELKGDLPRVVADLNDRIKTKESTQKNLESLIQESIVRRDSVDVEILSLKENIEKYKTQQFQVKTNKQYDTLSREIDSAQEKINKLQKEMDALEGKAAAAREDVGSIGPELELLVAELQEKKNELEHVNKEHEEEELKLNHEREKLVVRIDKNDLRAYERIRRAKDGKAVVPVRRNACGGCYKRVPPQTVLELRKHSKIIACEHCGRILVSDEIVNDSAKA